MSELLVASLTGLLVTALTGLTILAYKHPEGYKKLFLPMTIIMAIIVWSGVIWDVSVTATYSHLSAHIKEGQFGASWNAVADYRIMSNWQFWGLFIGFGLYITFSVTSLILRRQGATRGHAGPKGAEKKRSSRTARPRKGTVRSPMPLQCPSRPLQWPMSGEKKFHVELR
jgi:hypothetical protein